MRPPRRKSLPAKWFAADGTVVDGATVLPPGASVYLYRDLPDEVPVPFDIPVLHRDDDIVVVDKPHFLATMPRGRHVAQTALVRLRRELDLPELSPAHRLDRLTAGVLLFTARREVRGAYQTLFARGRGAQDVSGAGARSIPALSCRRWCAAGSSSGADSYRRSRSRASRTPRRSSSRLGDGLYRLTPRTGRTHQLRVHMASLGLPIIGDPLYPDVDRRCAATTSRRRCSCWRTARVRRPDQRTFAPVCQRGAVSTNDRRLGWQALAVSRQVDAGQ